MSAFPARAVGAKRRNHLLVAIVVIVIAENGEAAVASRDPRQDARDDTRRHPAATEPLHIHIVAAEQHQIRQERRDLPGNRRVARHVVGMRADMQVGQQGNAERPLEPRPARQAQRVVPHHMRLRPREELVEALAALRVGERLADQPCRDPLLEGPPFAHAALISRFAAAPARR